MDRTEIRAKVIDLVSETLECEADTLTDDARYEDLGADSFDLLELVTAFEDEFGFTMDDDALANIETIGDSIEAIVGAK